MRGVPCLTSFDWTMQEYARQQYEMSTSLEAQRRSTRNPFNKAYLW